MTERSKRRLRLLGSVAVGAAVVVLIAVIVSSSSSDTAKPKAKAGEAVAGQSDVAAMLDGIPQSGITLGNPKAKVTLVEFADLQCPVCQQYSLAILPTLVEKYVRTGKVRMDLRLVTILDGGDATGDSQRMARVAYGAQKQNRLWNFADLVFFNQGQERTGYATDQYMRRLAAAIPGLDVARAFAARGGDEATAQIGAATTLFGNVGARGTPTIMIGKTGGEMKVLDSLSGDILVEAIDSALA